MCPKFVLISEVRYLKSLLPDKHCIFSKLNLKDV